MEQLYFDGVLVEDANIIHDSTKKIFRDPLGAITGGTKLTIGLNIYGLNIDSVTLCVLHDGAINRIGMENEDGLLRARFTPPNAGTNNDCVLWYWFEIKISGGSVCYYGADPPYPSGLGRVYKNPPPGFQLTVYDSGFSTPNWAKSAVLYQVFPDRFCMGNADAVAAGIEYHRQMGRTEFELRENWSDLPVYKAKAGRKYYMPSDIFGGDLEGIRSRLPYLKELGVTLLYLNPVFESASNHRYNTGDYYRIDPILGDAETFRRLTAEAKEAGIRIILDGVFSHTGDDSVYFNKYGRYYDVGAYQSQDSPYYHWYRFDEYPKKYDSWWGFESLPEVNEFDPGWQDFVITGQNSVIKHWLHEGVSGYRLDVADELPDETIELIRSSIKATNPEAFLLGEVWEDATTKQSYGKQRSYALGRGLDAVMNYPFLNRTIEFLRETIDSWHYCKFLENQRHTYPAPMYFTLMNLLSSHDVSRIRTILACNVDPNGMPREDQARFTLSEEEFKLGGMRQRLAAAIQFSLPGIPSIYYGDEAGMTGLLDPFNRRAFHVEDADIAEWYRILAGIRHEHPVMKTGDIRFFSTDGDVLGLLRYSVGGYDFFGAVIEPDAVLTVINPKKEPRRIVFELNEVLEHIGTDPPAATSLLTGLEAPLEKGLVEIDMPALSAEIFRLA